jgi:hypothetical protein
MVKENSHLFDENTEDHRLLIQSQDIRESAIDF